jgi:extradiol dioxygenase family protein
MRDVHDVFHLAIPARDLDEAQDFYVGRLGCKLARRYEDRITLDFFGDQVVCHLSEDWEREPQVYPRHFGVTFRQKEDFDRLLNLVATRHLRCFREVETRFEGTVEEHLTMILIDPSNNLLEFKHYHDPRMMY